MAAPVSAASVTDRLGHRLVRREEIELEAALPGHSRGLTRAVLVGAATGSVHTGLTLVELEDGYVDTHVHSFESSFFVLEGEPVLYLDGRGVRLVSERVRRTSRRPAPRLAERRPRPLDRGGLAAPAPSRAAARHVLPRRRTGRPPGELDLRDPRNRHLFLLSDDDMDVARLCAGMRSSEPKVSASMATAALLYSGITVKMLVDKRLDAQLHTMFMVGYQPGAQALPHDHPFEESYYMLEGEVDVVADDTRYTLYPGDVFWTAVGCIHAFYETKGGTVKWLESSAPGPPDRHSYRFERDWESLLSP